MTSYKLSDFGPKGSEKMYTLANLIRMFLETSTSWTNHAWTTDEEIYESMLDEDGNPPESKGRVNPSSVEWGPTGQLLALIAERLDVLGYYITKDEKVKKNIKRIPGPMSAADLNKARKVADDREEVLSFSRFFDPGDAW
jgi:hypothetical protein